MDIEIRKPVIKKALQYLAKYKKTVIKINELEDLKKIMEQLESILYEEKR